VAAGQRRGLQPEVQVPVQGPVRKEVDTRRQEQGLFVDAREVHHFTIETQTLAQTQAVAGFPGSNRADRGAPFPAHSAKKHGQYRGNIIEMHRSLRMVRITAGGGSPPMPVATYKLLEFQQMQHGTGSAARPTQSEPKAIAITSSRASWTSGSSVSGSTSVARVACITGIPEAISVAQ